MSDEYTDPVELARYTDGDRIYRVTWQEKNGQIRISCREWYEAPDGELQPSPRGFQVKGFDSLIPLWQVIRAALVEAVSEGLVSPGSYMAKRGQTLPTKLLAEFAKLRAKRARQKAKGK